VSHGFAFVDTETTGRHAEARIIEIAVVTYSPTGRRTGSKSQLVRGDGTVGDWAAQKVHGIRAQDLVGKPAFAEVWPELTAMLHGHYVFAHNAPFDLKRINYELSRIRRAAVPSMGCTMRLAYDLGYAQKKTATKPTVSAKLSELVGRLKLPVDPDHRALNDTEAVAALFWYFRKRHTAKVDSYLARITPFGGAHAAPLAAPSTSVARATAARAADQATPSATSSAKVPQKVQVAADRTRAALTDTLTAMRSTDATSLSDFKAATTRAKRAHLAAQDRLNRARETQRGLAATERDFNDLLSTLRAAEEQRRAAIAELAGLRRLFMGADRRQLAERRRTTAASKIASIERRISKARRNDKAARSKADQETQRRRKELDAARRELDRAQERQAAVRARIKSITARGFRAPGESEDLREWVAAMRQEVSRLLKIARSKRISDTDRRRLDRLVTPSN